MLNQILYYTNIILYGVYVFDYSIWKSRRSWQESERETHEDVGLGDKA